KKWGTFSEFPESRKFGECPLFLGSDTNCHIANSVIYWVASHATRAVQTRAPPIRPDSGTGRGVSGCFAALFVTARARYAPSHSGTGPARGSSVAIATRVAATSRPRTRANVAECC